jgi:hypothetical protein
MEGGGSGIGDALHGLCGSAAAEAFDAEAKAPPELLYPADGFPAEGYS